MIFFVCLGVWLIVVIVLLVWVTPKHSHYFDTPVQVFDKGRGQYRFMLKCDCDLCVEVPDAIVNKIGPQNFHPITYDSIDSTTNQRSNSGTSI
jgi:hypothetical protein